MGTPYKSTQIKQNQVKYWLLRKRGNRSTRIKTPRNTRFNPGIELGTQWWDAIVLSPLRQPCSICLGNRVDLLLHFGIYEHESCFESSQNITSDHKFRNAGTSSYDFITYYILNKFPSFRLVNDECINRL